MTIRSAEDKLLIEQFRKLLSIQEGTLEYLQSLSVDAETLNGFRLLIRYLRTRSADQMIRIMTADSHDPGTLKLSRNPKPLASDQEIGSWTLDQVREQLNLSTLPRKSLEKIAAIRFGVSRGALSSIRNREGLLQKLFTLIDNEGAHNSIERVIRSTESKE